jgi:LEA14-like dessication related protein
MTPSTKRALWIGGGTIFALLLFLTIREVTKLLNYTIKFGRFQKVKISPNELIFDIFVKLDNPSNIPLTLTSQTYDVYINNNFVTNVNTNVQTTLEAKKSTEFPLRINVNPNDITKAMGTNWALLLLTPEKVVITTIFKVKVKVLGITIPIKSKYPISLAEILNIPKVK